MKKVINFCKQRYKTLIPLMVVLVLLLTVYFLYKEYKYDNYRDKKEVSVYQYFGGIKNEYKVLVTRNLKKEIVDVQAIDRNVNFGSKPIYYQKGNKILFPKEMVIVFTLRNGSQYKLYKYATITRKDDAIYIENGSDTGEYDYFFLYDGDGLYFFPYEMTLKINNKEYIKLGENSYVSYVGGYTLAYYDTSTEKSEVLEIEGKKVEVVSENLKINVVEKYLVVADKEVLLASPDILKPVFKTD